MTIDNLTKTQYPSAADRAFCAQLITDHGLHRAALKLGVSKLALMNASIGGALYSKTQQAIRKAREAA